MGIMGIGGSGMGTVTFRNADGTASGTMGVSRSQTKKKKKLVYNHREISGQIMRARTSVSAKQVAARAFQKVATLYRQLRSGEYDENKVRRAIIHAEQIAQVSRKKVKHLQEEERGKKGGPCEAEMEEEQDEIRLDEIGMEIAGKAEADAEEMKEFMEGLEETLEELESLDELEELTTVSYEDMDPEDLDLLKKKHRAKELREITEADMKYLKALFQELEKERQDSQNAVSLELAGIEMPIPAAEIPAAIEGGNIDVTV